MKKFIIALAFCFAHHAWGDGQLSTRVVYSSTNCRTTSAWVQLVASMPYASNSLNIFDSSGQTMQLGVGSTGIRATAHYHSPGRHRSKSGY